MKIQTRLRRPWLSPGFSLVELMISLAILTLVLVGTLALFDRSNQLAASQLARSDLQQAARVSQNDLTRRARLIGRGGMPVATGTYMSPQGTAVSVRNNVPVSSNILDGDTTSPDVLEGTDVLTMRGAFDFPMYYVAYRDPTTISFDPNFDRGFVRLEDVISITAGTQLTQDLDPLGELITAGRPVAVMMVSAASNDVWGVAELVPGDSVVETGLDADPDVDRIQLAFRYYDDSAIDGEPTTVDPVAPGSKREAFSALSSLGYYPEGTLLAARVKTLSVLQEFRYYVRDAYEIEGVASSGPSPKLSRAEMYPNTDDVYPEPGVANLAVDIADDVWDLQVAAGCDPHEALPAGRDGLLPESADGVGDAWEGNNVADLGTCAQSPLHVRTLRFSTLIRAARPSRDYMAPEIDRIEDRDYDATSFQNQAAQRLFQRHVIRTLVDLRNL